MSDTCDMWKAEKARSKLRRAKNRKNSTQILKDKGIPFIIKNNGVHLIVTGPECLIDYYPSTGKWIARGDKQGRGVFDLLRYIDKHKD